MARSDVYAQPDAPDPVLSAATVLRLARACLGRADAVTAVDESGGEARVYVVDERVVVKTQRPHRVRARTSLAKEVRLLEYLAGPLAGQIPTVYGYDRVQTAEGTVEYIVMSRIPGQATRHASVTGAARTHLLRTLGQLLRQLHALSADPLVDADLFPTDDNAAALRRRLELGLTDVVDRITSQPGRWTLAVSPDEVASRATNAL
ncbi:MAG TPA: phosphotransferase, partial [Pseudonocardiaceae bacterium]|nr:phosphotransferase [Pseudonocardiaceae bacterium]